MNAESSYPKKELFIYSSFPLFYSIKLSRVLRAVLNISYHIWYVSNTEETLKNQTLTPSTIAKGLSSGLEGGLRVGEVEGGSKQILEITSRPNGFPQLSISSVHTVENPGMRETLLPLGKRSSQFLLRSGFSRHFPRKQSCAGTPLWNS